VAELTAQGYDATDTPGEKSQFDVLVDGRSIFSKQREGRYPDADEIVAALGA
jgi:predicted Rdx family selenoprotein